jgi:16S rRNA processing protein RimM
MPSTPNDSIPVGRIAGIFGIQGELKCDPTSAGRSLFSAGESLHARFPQGELREVRIASVREHKGRLLIRLEGVDSANDAEFFTGVTFFADASRITLDAGEYLDRDLVGCELVDLSGKALGKVERLEHYPASDMLIVNGNMVPMVAAFVKAIDVASKRITVDLPAGLLDPENAY